MVEIELEQKEGPDGPGPEQQQLVLCKVYMSPRTDEAEPSVPCTPAPPPAASKSSEKSSCDNQKITTECKTTLDYNSHSPGVARKPGTQCKPTMGGKITRGVAIVKKGSVTAAVTVVMKFGGSSMKSADDIKEMAKFFSSFPSGGGNPVVVLSAMGNTTTNLLVAAGKALRCNSPKEASKIHELVITKDMHLRMIDDLGLDRSIVSGSLNVLERVFLGIANVKGLNSETRDYLVSFGEKVSTTIFSAYLNKLGKGTCQEWGLYAVNTCGRGGSDLTVITIGRDLGSREIQVWKDVDGVLTCDPNICANAIPLPYLTFDEAAELGLFGAQSVQLAMEGGIQVTVKNSRNPQARGTLITPTRDMSKSILTSIVLKSNITMLNIKSRRVLGQSSFLATSFSIFEKLGVFINCLATSEGKISLITVPSKTSSRELVQLELDNVVGELKEIAVVDRLDGRSAISLIGNTQMSQLILEKASNVLSIINVKAQMISQASSEVMKLYLVVNDDEAEHCVQALHSAFFENGSVSEAQAAEKERPIPSAAASSSGVKKRKARDEHHPPGVCQERADNTADRSPSVDERTAFPDNDPSMPNVGGDDYVGVPADLLDIILDNNPVPSRVNNDGLPAAGLLPQPQAVEPDQPSGAEANHGVQEEYNRLRAFLDHDSPMPGDNGAGDQFRWFTDVPEPDYPMFDDNGLVAEVLDVGDYSIDIPMLNAEAEQQERLAEVAEGSSPLVTEEEEEVIEALIAGDELFVSTSRDMSWSPPELASSLHVAGECQAAFCGLCFTEEIGT